MESFRRNQDTDSSARIPPPGPYAPCHMPGDPLVYPGCGQPVKAVCDMDQIGELKRDTAAQGTNTVDVGPRRMEYFQVLAGRMVVSGNSDPQLNGRVFLQQWEVNQQPVKGWVNGAPGLTNTSGLWSDQYIAPDGYGIPEPGYIVSQANLTQRLTIGWTNFEPSAGGVSLDVAVSLWGNGLSQCPAGYRKFNPA